MYAYIYIYIYIYSLFSSPPICLFFSLSLYLSLSVLSSLSLQGRSDPTFSPGDPNVVLFQNRSSKWSLLLFGPVQCIWPHQFAGAWFSELGFWKHFVALLEKAQTQTSLNLLESRPPTLTEVLFGRSGPTPWVLTLRRNQNPREARRAS